MCTIMPFLNQGLILYNRGPADLSVTIICSHSSVVLYILTDHDVNFGIYCIACVAVENPFFGRPNFRLIAEYSLKQACSQSETPLMRPSNYSLCPNAI